ncbi:hypothetical protein Tco_0798188 [Tanacetum coccineum]
MNKDKITKVDLEGPTFELVKNIFKNSIEVEYNMKQCYLAMTNGIDWANLKGYRFYTYLSKPLPLEGPPGRKTIPTRYFFNNDLEYLKYGNQEKKYALSLSKIKAARYEQEGIAKIIPHLWSPSIQKYDRNAELETDFPRLNQNNIEDLYLLKIQDKIHNLVGVDEYDLTNALLLYLRRIVIRKRGVIYLRKDKQKMLMRADEIHKFSDGTLNKVYNKLDVMLRDNKLGYENEGIKDRAWAKKDKERTKLMMEKIKKTLKERRRMRRLDC